MSTVTIHDAEQLVTPPSWATFPDYQRKSDWDGASADVFIMDTATIIDTPLLTVRAERQAFVRADGYVEPPLESVRLISQEEDGYIEISCVAAVVEALSKAALIVGGAS